jgi:hypothetical protein
MLASVGFLTLAVASASAQTIPDIGGLGNVNENSDGDLVLGFTNTANANDLLVDIGPADYYYSSTNSRAGENPNGALTPGTTYTVSAYNSADLATVFGANADTASTKWAIIGGTGPAGGPGTEPADTLWASSPGAVWNSASATAQAPLSARIDGFTNSMFDGTQLASPDAMSRAASAGNSFANEISASGNFIYFPSAANGTTAALATSGTSSLTLYELLPGSGAGIDLGTFTLSSTGLTFTAFAAIPEPSTYAAILGAMTLGFVLIRRRIRSSSLDVQV